MRTSHVVTLGICAGMAALVTGFVGCGTDTFGSCTDTNSCGDDAGTDSSSTFDQYTGDTYTGGDTSVASDGPKDGPGGDVKDSPVETGPTCDSGTDIICSGVCVDKETDPNNCNGCGKVCPGPDSGTGKGICVNGACGLACESDAGTTLLCPSGCVDPTTILNCGACANACTVPPSNGTATCSGSPLACGLACDAGYHPAGGTACNATCAPDTVDPSTDPCLVVDGRGIFVTPTGNDSLPGDGTKEHPFGSIGHAMDVAVAGTKRVYACGTFTGENLKVTSTRDGVSVYGGFDCTTWAYNAATKTKLSPSAAGYALEVDSATTGVRFEDFEFDSVSASATPSATPASSIAVFVNGSAIALARVAVTAGSGQPGNAGAQVPNWVGTVPGGSSPSSLVTGGTGGGPTQCGDVSTSLGGTGASVPGTATTGTPGANNAGLSGGASCTPGGAGAPGTPSATVATGVTTSGSTTSSGWVVSGAGSAGGIGGVAQGGGGGGSNASASGGAGGGGGAGGCGGGKGTGGFTGGSSIGILSFQSTLTLTTITVQTQAGGGGGAGGPGQAGQGGGGSGHGGGSGNCAAGQGGGAGGGGGTGGGGSGGGGGAGGATAGVVWKGTTAPTIDGTAITQQATLAGITLGAPGAAGLGGSGSTTAGNGAAGQALAVMQSP